jgi:hypothetical protein
MKNTALSLTALALACCCAVPAFAQYDSSRLDAGYLQLKKDFTQTITIEGADLEKMPFTDLSDAIAAWFYGAYTQPVTLQYVVDGNPVTDVNAYSIFDIEEVVLVQNAAALVNTADGQQELVIVRTKRGQGKRGMTANVQTGLLDAKEYGHTSSFGMYHNYYLTVWQNSDKVSVGVSGNYQRDVLPFPYESGVTIPDNMQRWRLNGYFTWRPNSHNQIEFMLNYTPQRMAFNMAQTASLEDAHGTQHFILPRLLWHSELSTKWTNDLQATYVHSTDNASDNSYGVNELTPDSLQEVYYGTSSAIRSTHLWIRDHLGYTATAGHWNIEPAINVSYEHFNEQNWTSTAEETSTYEGGNLVNGLTPNIGTLQSNLKENKVVVTPALDISYKRVLDVQGGVLVDAGKQDANSGRYAFPFASLTLDLLRLANDKATSGLKVFGSYAQRAAPSPQGYALTDLSTNIYGSSNSPIQNYSTYNLNSTTNYTVPVYPAAPVYWVWEAGASYTGWKDRLTIQYTFEQRNFLKTLFIYEPNNSFSIVYPEWRSTLQHVDIRVKVLDAEGVRWLTGINVTLLQNKTPSIYANVVNYYDKQDVGDDSPSPHSWTGGWVNRVQVKRFTAGFDLLYHFGESVPSSNYSDTGKVNSVITPNVYVGYNLHLSAVRTLELFLESRGLIRNSANDLLDDRRYYTVGGKLSI